MKTRSFRRATLIALLASALSLGAVFIGTISFADSSASELPPNWHVHDGQTSLGPQHKGIGFFPRILGVSQSVYVQDPARCPNATDKAFLPSWGEKQAALLRAGVCFTGTSVIHLRTVPVGTDGPEGWASLTAASEPGWITYYSVTAN
jgi:hypothetical protein